MQDRGEKMEARRRKAAGLRAMVRSLADYAAPTAGRIFDNLSQAHLNERNAESSRLAREALLGENSDAEIPEELSLAAIGAYHRTSGGLYEAAALDYLFGCDMLRAYTYARKACRQWRLAVEMLGEMTDHAHQQRRQCCQRAAMIRQEVALRSLWRRRWSLGLLGRLR